jgi:protein-disulfide isomerase
MTTNNKTTLALSIVAAALIIGGVILYFGKSSNTAVAPQLEQADQDLLASRGLSVKGLPVLGDPKAPVTLVEFGDFQCSYCVLFFDKIKPAIQKQFIDTGKANMFFKTLAFIGRESTDAGLASACAAQEGKFWEMYDAIYSAELSELSANKNNENSGNLTRDFFATQAEKIGLDKEKFLSCYDQKKYLSLFDENLQDAIKAMGQQVGTPTLFVIKNGTAQKVQNPFDLSNLERIINQ